MGHSLCLAGFGTKLGGGHPTQHVVMSKLSLASFHCVPLHSVAVNSCEEKPNDFVISISHNHSGQIITVENMF